MPQDELVAGLSGQPESIQAQALLAQMLDRANLQRALIAKCARTKACRASTAFEVRGASGKLRRYATRLNLPNRRVRDPYARWCGRGAP
jgi:hypothetical protein